MTANNTYTFSDKWSSRIESGGFTNIPNILIKNQSKLGITDPEMVVIMCLALYKWDRRLPYPSVSTLSEHTGKTPGAIRNNVRSLEKKGLIKRVYRDNQSNQYDLRPLVKVLESYTQPIKKITSVRHKFDTRPYQNINTKEYATNNTKERRHREYSGKLTHISESLKRHQQT